MIGGRRRNTIGLAMLAMVVGTLVVTWRLTSLDGLPDVGDPFDVAEFADVKVPDDRNAFTLYRQAVKRLTQPPEGTTHLWATAGAAEKEWLARNHEAFELWRRGTERPEALYLEPRSMKFDTGLPVIQDLRTFARGASLEGTRREAEGDTDGALTWYIAMIRSARHLGMHGIMIERLVGNTIFEFGCSRLNRWAADPRVNSAMLRRAIDAAVVVEEMERPPSAPLKAEYLAIMNSIDDPKMMTPEVLEFLTGQNRAAKAETSLAKVMREDIPKILKREPERSRRVIRLIFANQLAYCDRPPAQQPPRAETIPPGFLPPTPPPAASRTTGTVPLLVNLFAVDPSAPEAARALPPAEIARWFDSTLYARLCLPAIVHYEKAIVRGRAAQSTLLARLRAELESREHPQPVEANPGGDRP